MERQLNGSLQQWRKPCLHRCRNAVPNPSSSLLGRFLSPDVPPAPAPERSPWIRHHWLQRRPLRIRSPCEASGSYRQLSARLLNDSASLHPLRALNGQPHFKAAHFAILHGVASHVNRKRKEPEMRPVAVSNPQYRQRYRRRGLAIALRHHFAPSVSDTSCSSTPV